MQVLVDAKPFERFTKDAFAKMVGTKVPITWDGESLKLTCEVVDALTVDHGRNVVLTLLIPDPLWTLVRNNEVRFTEPFNFTWRDEDGDTHSTSEEV